MHNNLPLVITSLIFLSNEFIFYSLTKNFVIRFCFSLILTSPSHHIFFNFRPKTFSYWKLMFLNNFFCMSSSLTPFFYYFCFAFYFTWYALSQIKIFSQLITPYFPLFHFLLSIFPFIQKIFFSSYKLLDASCQPVV